MKSLLNLRIQKTQHSHSVFQLRKSVIPSAFRKLPLCKNIKLITGMDKMNSMLLVNPLLPSFNNLQSRLRRFPVKGLQRVKTLAEF